MRHNKRIRLIPIILLMLLVLLWCAGGCSTSPPNSAEGTSGTGAESTAITKDAGAKENAAAQDDKSAKKDGSEEGSAADKKNAAEEGSTRAKKAGPEEGSTADKEGTAAEATTEEKISDYVEAKKAGTLKIGLIPGKPIFYQEEGSKEWIGFGADRVWEYAQRLGLQPEYIPVEAGQVQSMLEERQIDCVWGRLNPADMQNEALSFSVPYLRNKLAVIVQFKNKDKEKCKDKKQIKKMKEFVVVAGSAAEDKAKELGANYSTEEDLVHCFLRVAAGTASCALADAIEAGPMIGEGTQYENLVTTVTFDAENISVGFRKDSDLIPALNAYFAAAWGDGSAKKSGKKYHIENMVTKVE